MLGRRRWLAACLVVLGLGCDSAENTPPPGGSGGSGAGGGGGEGGGVSAGNVLLNEALQSPGSQEDWVEILATDAPVDLSGARLQITPKSGGAALNFVIPQGTIVKPGEPSLLNDALLSKDKPAHACAAGFQLPEGPIDIAIVDAGENVLAALSIDQATWESHRPGLSFGRFPDGTGPVMLQGRPTPSAANSGPASLDSCLSAPAAGEFHDHSYPCVGSPDSYFWLAGSRAGTTTVKFIVQSWREPEKRHISFLDSVFYSIHDEWYFFRMLNGHPVEGDDVYMPYNGSFSTIDEIYSWALASETLPYDTTFLDWNGDKLLSRRFYDMAIDIQPRLLGAGTLVYVPERTHPPAREAIWGFELEYRDAITHEDLTVYFDELKERLPAEIWDKLHWIVRSPVQEELAQTMEQTGLPYSDRVLRYTDLSVPGETQVYNGGLVAGRLRVVHAGEPGIESTTTTDILVLEEIPDYLPPCKALITTIPQTPLSHISLLAKARGIPNLYIGDVANDPAWDQWGRVRARLALYAEAPDKYKVVGLTEAEYDAWLALVPDVPHILPPIDLTNAPLTVDLTTEDAANMSALRPILGGKSAGFLALLDTPGLIAPDHPVGITARAYDEHIKPLQTAFLDDLLKQTEFKYLTHRRARYLVLEGEAAYDEKFPTPSGVIFKKTFLKDHPPGDLMGDLIAQGGVRQIIRSKPVAPATLSQIQSALAAQFVDFSPKQGLRFRSSSNVEDVDGFNGAGLYESHTGFLNPAAALDPDDKNKTIERALQKTWASYWSWEAYDERLTANINHLSGHMGVLVHARFDDNQEISNGVFTLTRFPDEPPAHAPAQFADRYEMWVNVQSGAVSVTNPPPGKCVLPESIRVHLPVGSDTPLIERIQGSTEVTPGAQILSDAALLSLFDQAVAVTDKWLELEKSDLPEAQRRRTLTLDFEMRQMAAGWPTLASGPAFGERMIVKQARSLEPSISNVPALVLGMPFPRDILGRARNVTRRVCSGNGLTLTAVEATTDPLKSPDLGYKVAPFTASVDLDVTANLPELGWTAGTKIGMTHTQLASVDHPGMANGAEWTLVLDVDPAAQVSVGLSALAWTPGQTVILKNASGAEVTIPVSMCTVETLYATPDNYLLTLLGGTN